jgi:hypothetical protein
MTRYFFHIQDGVRYEDETGTELPDLTAVRKRALKVCETCWRAARIRIYGTDTSGG